MITKMRGFTLIETLLALAILAVLSAAAVMVLQNVIRADGLTREKSQQIAALQRAFARSPTMSRTSFPVAPETATRFSSPDVSSCRATTGAGLPAAAAGRTHWGSSRVPEIQNVSYRLRQQQLERLSFDQQDPLTGSQPTVRVVLREVTAFRLRFYADGRWQETRDRSQTLPQGLEITLTLANSGEITRLFLLTPGGSQ